MFGTFLCMYLISTAMTMSKAPPRGAPLPQPPSLPPQDLWETPVFLTSICPQPLPQRQGLLMGVGRGRGRQASAICLFSAISPPPAPIQARGVTAESGYSSHSLPSPLPSKCHKPCQSDQPQLRGCSPNTDSTQDQSSALTPRGHTCLWDSAGGRGREPHCFLQPHFPPSPLALSPPTNPTQNLLPLIRGNSKGGRETGAGPPNT